MVLHSHQKGGGVQKKNVEQYSDRNIINEIVLAWVICLWPKHCLGPSVRDSALFEEPSRCEIRLDISRISWVSDQEKEREIFP